MCPSINAAGVILWEGQLFHKQETKPHFILDPFAGTGGVIFYSNIVKIIKILLVPISSNLYI